MDTTMNDPYDDYGDDRYGRMPDPSDRSEGRYYRGINTKRFFAWVIDSVLILIIGTILIPFTVFTAVFILPFFFFVVGFTYRVLTLAGGSATFGMRIVGMELRRDDGTKFDLGTSVMHTGLYTVAVAVFPLQLISIIMMLVSERKQGLHDMILSTGPIRRAA